MKREETGLHRVGGELRNEYEESDVVLNKGGI